MENKEKSVLQKDSVEINNTSPVKKKYVTPAIQFVSIKVEERLMTCTQVDLACPEPHVPSTS